MAEADINQAVAKMMESLDKGTFRPLQNRLQRCAMECQDRAKDSLSSQPSESQISAAQAGMEKCVSKCVDGHIKLLPTLKKRIEDTVSSAAH
ncbi:hypothetical protein B5M09_003770 [Aphanomyces astaci]|uniref:Mitochondrial import inner membrane translocase subunit n=1 Tax=Aphanomyces astaci TaxID=112090 RepID=A0A3R7X7A9_APHAT|nr:hypothetical protein B5M09_003770 [Aphanomyces astaci]